MRFLGPENSMTHNLFSMIHKIAKRNGSAKYYPLITYVEDGVRYMTCDGWLPAETDDIWLFSDVNDEEARLLLEAFVAGTTYCTYDVQRHFMRLLAIKGALVARQMDEIVGTTDWESYASPQLLLSYLAAKPDGVKWILKLLDVVLEDARDGILTACWYCNDKRVQKKLFEKFEEWSAESAGWGGGTGEDVWLGRFLTKWTKGSTFGWQRMKNLMEWAVRHNLMFR